MVGAIEGLVDTLHKQLKVGQHSWHSCSCHNMQPCQGRPHVLSLQCCRFRPLAAPILPLHSHAHPPVQDKRNASMALQCLGWAVGTFLRRMAPPRTQRAKLLDWAAWAVGPPIQGATKGGLAATAEQQARRAGRPVGWLARARHGLCPLASCILR